ncbi:reverse transcriptase domain-containing protein [Tanacetum coccineum]
MHTRIPILNLLRPLPELEYSEIEDSSTKQKSSFDQRNNPPQNPRIVYPPILDINYFRHFLVTLKNLYPMDDEPMWAADCVVASTPGSAITIPETANEFAIKVYHLVFSSKEPIDEIPKNEVVRLMMFPLSLSGEAKTWLDKLNEGTIEMWDELRTAFISQFFPPALFDRLLGEIRAFSQHENESLTDAWLRMKEMLRNCHGHNLSKGNIIKIFYHGLSEITQEVLNATAGAENMLIEVDKFTFPVDFIILEMEDSKVPLILGRPFLHTADAVIRVKQKQLNLGVGTERMIFNIDYVMKYSYSNDDTCFSIDVINEILEEDLDALLDEGSKILHSIEGTLLE